MMFGVVLGEGMGARTKPRRKLALIPNIMYERKVNFAITNSN